MNKKERLFSAEGVISPTTHNKNSNYKDANI